MILGEIDMKIKNGILLNNWFIDALSAFVKLPLPVRVSFPLQKCLKVFQAEEPSIRTAKEELVKKYGQPQYNDEKQLIGWDITKAKELDKQKFSEEFSALINIEFDIPLESKLELNIKEIEDLKVSSEHLMNIQELIIIKED